MKPLFFPLAVALYAAACIPTHVPTEEDKAYAAEVDACAVAYKEWQAMDCINRVDCKYGRPTCSWRR